MVAWSREMRERRSGLSIQRCQNWGNKEGEKLKKEKNKGRKGSTYEAGSLFLSGSYSATSSTLGKGNRGRAKQNGRAGIITCGEPREVVLR